jgi:hypothetical protein
VRSRASECGGDTEYAIVYAVPEFGECRLN